MRQAQFLRAGSFMLMLFLFSSCYSEYKTIPAAKTGNSGTVGVKAEVQAISVFPVIPKHYQAVIDLTNNDKQSIYLSNITLALKRHSHKNEQLLKSLNADSVMLKPGEQYHFNCLFAKHSPLFYPHKVTLVMTASLRSGNSKTTIEDNQQFVRYMYVNIAGD